MSNKTSIKNMVMRSAKNGKNRAMLFNKLHDYDLFFSESDKNCTVNEFLGLYKLDCIKWSNVTKNTFRTIYNTPIKRRLGKV